MDGLPEPGTESPLKPRSMSLALLVETALAVGVPEGVPVAVLGREPLESQGELVLAPFTPKATVEASSMEPVRVTVIVAEDSAEEAKAHHTSVSS